MTNHVIITPGNINPEQHKAILDAFENDGVIAYPTDSGYALGCKAGSIKAQERIKEIREFDSHHNFTLMCRDLSEIAQYAKVDTPTYRLLKKYSPGAFTFILPATQKVPKIMLNKSKKTIGIRVPTHQTPLDLCNALGSPFLTVSLIMPGDINPLIDADDVEQALGDEVDLLLNCYYCGHEPTTVLDCTESEIKIIRQGAGEFA